MKKLLIALELFLAGGLTALLLVGGVLARTLPLLTTHAAQVERLNVLDKMLGYYAAYGLALVVVGVLLVVAWLWSLARRQPPAGARTELAAPPANGPAPTKGL